MTTAILPALASMPAHVWGPGHGPVWFFLFPLFWILLIGFFIFFSRRMYWRHRVQGDPMGAEGVLRERYARGEIDETEYRQRLEVLRANRK
ncbi:SHOCT domain-containing protein [Paeniglutamicibacter sulfureus]|uniref:Membrane protein n=1 Tax=Paeniglutamicibacter sulfureus TaxID=43666 RepID=A0ABU2BG62_9MICC|nr:SHOCT domain-containing protein [Paeniglutamicibacter sulfureus]MDO2933299.1 SHOCT domain-containing protein [Paeniglutamicibacter sulfureus]MDR7357610.1 putative membrane protein [Paeniglutamicibacter sulfureus]